MFPFTNPLNGSGMPFGPGNQGGPGSQGGPGNQGGQQGQQGAGYQNPFTNWSQPFQNGGGGGGGFPFDSSQLQQQIQETISSSMPDFMRGSQSNKKEKTSEDPKVDVFETHDFVVARIPVKEDQGKKPKLSLDTNRLYIKGLDNSEKPLVVPLPSPIKPKYTKAEYKSGVLEVRMLKKGPEPMTDITIEG